MIAPPDTLSHHVFYSFQILTVSRDHQLKSTFIYNSHAFQSMLARVNPVKVSNYRLQPAFVVSKGLKTNSKLQVLMFPYLALWSAKVPECVRISFPYLKIHASLTLQAFFML